MTRMAEVSCLNKFLPNFPKTYNQLIHNIHSLKKSFMNATKTQF